MQIHNYKTGHDTDTKIQRTQIPKYPSGHYTTVTGYNGEIQIQNKQNTQIQNFYWLIGQNTNSQKHKIHKYPKHTTIIGYWAKVKKMHKIHK